MKYKAVIGALFGDEGKGTITNLLTDNEGCLGVRFSGGSQAAHTVTYIDEDISHVYHHFPVAYGNSRDVYLAEKFIVNPIMFVEEYYKLYDLMFHDPFTSSILSRTPKIFVDTKCIVSTMWDSYINHLAEKRRGNNRHGSCGLGINETVHRCESKLYELTVGDLLKGSKHYINILSDIRNKYIPKRLEELGIELNEEEKSIIHNPLFFTDMIDAIDVFVNTITPCSKKVLSMYNDIVFEGAQGLCLDEDHKWFPHVTRAKTGITNILDMIDDTDDLEVYYITRCYTTRHGAGPMPTEQDDLSDYLDIVDPTNKPNEHQGSLRVGYLDIDLLVESITNDQGGRDMNTNIVVTCIDQMKLDTLKVVVDSEIQVVTLDELCYIIKNKIKVQNIYFSDTPKGKMIRYEDKNRVCK